MRRTRLRVCLAGSGGGHLRQLLDLRPAVEGYDYFFVSEDSPLSKSLSERVHFVDHFGLGQARLGAPLTMARAAFRNLFQSMKIMWRERPDVVITTGAGAVFFSVVVARFLGAKVVVVESFARFDSPSVFGRLTFAIANRLVVQSKGMASIWPKAAVFDPLMILDKPCPEKKPLLFVTVGAILPFDRMVDTVAQLKASGAIPEQVLMQVGVGGMKPAGIETAETFPFEEMQVLMSQADIVVCHGGTGSIITALREGCRVIAVPRLFSHGEVYDGHQVQICAALAKRGLIAVANSSEELVEALREVRGREPTLATSDPSELNAYLAELLSEWDSASHHDAAEPPDQAWPAAEFRRKVAPRST